MAKQSSTWKAVERAIAVYIGGRRLPITGRHDQTTPDIAHRLYAVEIKHRRIIPKWLGELVDAHGDNLTAVFSNAGSPIRLFRLRDLASLGTVAHTVGTEAVIARRLPMLITDAIKQSLCASAALKKRPLVILHSHRQRIEDSICLLILPPIARKRAYGPER